MKILTRILIVLALAGLGYWLWTLWFPSDEAVIRKRVQRLAALLTFDSKQGNFAVYARTEEVANLFAPEVEILLEGPGDLGPRLSRGEIRQLAVTIRKQVSGMQVRFMDVTPNVTPDSGEAVVTLTAEVQVSSDPDVQVQEMKFQLRKLDGKWLITRVETVRTLN